MKEMENKILKNIPKVIADLETNTLNVIPLPFLVPFIEFLNQNRGFMKAMLGPNGDITFQSKLKMFMRKALFDSNKNSAFKREDLLVPPEYVV
ncbi:TetR-like C-terminal domain-containing protein [Bacillus sp. FJAT-45066]|uniref:TetR-like C-terminal domain-containing protein n=1 Tax=Bacillus sp. FJAT-45066 TaxID=2011010 RepID=UPI001596EC12